MAEWPQIGPSWSVHSFERLQANRHGALSEHRTWFGARWASRRDEDLVVFGPYWPSWVDAIKRGVCRIRGHRVRRSTAVWVRDLDCPPTTLHCGRCGAELGSEWRTYGRVVKYGREGVTCCDGVFIPAGQASRAAPNEQEG